MWATDNMRDTVDEGRPVTVRSILAVFSVCLGLQNSGCRYVTKEDKIKACLKCGIVVTYSAFMLEL